MVDVEALSSSDPRVAAKGRGFFWLATCLCGGLLLLHAGWLVSALQLAGALCLGFAVFLYSSQSRMLYAPCPDPRLPRKTSANPHPYNSPRHHAIQFEDVRIRTADGVALHGWWMTQAAAPVRSTAPTLVFFHGNAGNIGFRVPNFHSLYTQTRCNILAIDYRGYGESGDPEGAIDEQGLQRDAEAAWAWVKARPEIDQAKVFLFGRSLGGAVAIALAAALLARRATDLPAGLILENTFTSVADMARNLFPPLTVAGPVVDRLVHNKWPSLDRIRTIKLPVLFLGGARDELVPPQQFARLVAACPAPLKRTHLVADGGHNDTFLKGGHDYYKAMNSFFKEARKFQPEAQDGGDRHH